jgi:hypothetical protein
VGSRADLDVCEKSRPPTGIRSPDRPARSQSLYRLSYPGPFYMLIEKLIFYKSPLAVSYRVRSESRFALRLRYVYFGCQYRSCR